MRKNIKDSLIRSLTMSICAFIVFGVLILTVGLSVWLVGVSIVLALTVLLLGLSIFVGSIFSMEEVGEVIEEKLHNVFDKKDGEYKQY